MTTLILNMVNQSSNYQLAMSDLERYQNITLV